MTEKTTAANILNNLVETLAESSGKQKSVSFFEENKSDSVTSQINRLFGRQKPVHRILGGGKSADVLLWRNKKISASVLTGATAVWVLFEWLNYHLLTLISFALVLGMLAQFVLTNASGLLNRSPSTVPRLVLPDDLFVNIAVSVGYELNRALGFLQDVACGGNLKQLLVVIASLWAAAVIGGWCNFLTVLYIGFVAAHTLPVLYEKYEDEVDSFVYKVFEQLQHNYKKLDAGVLSRIPKGKFKGKKAE
ncbi:reticulon-like protein B8 [Ziziphus jujuba]|uniref:Reticulon-like protein n=1 Tax=Ziziphus jujuba TaxID=326968 RepID=A0A6P6G2R3_ZIZJJ|nr:reticulon-like protein B8 [Ziziphus jujuba]XP_015880631.1 reticulon-like protein B8 [Ziziphus jujuba]XP_015880632.1 reticulon-like protein B8 [Ziziphus jujuba]XP_024928414.1 reticulon-like protein B8 [Ziziphus jujuba]XP_024928415.1 reticulon-like protein B8 [Ziziphus jujuba]